MSFFGTMVISSTLEIEINLINQFTITDRLQLPLIGSSWEELLKERHMNDIFEECIPSSKY